MDMTPKSLRNATVDGRLLSGLEGVMVAPLVDEDQVIGQGCTCKPSSKNIQLDKRRPGRTTRNRIHNNFGSRELFSNGVHSLSVGPHRCTVRSWIHMLQRAKKKKGTGSIMLAGIGV